jgi:hypothetical protein
MLTVRHIEKLWEAKKYPRLLDELIAPRVECLAAKELSAAPCLAAAALALVRLEEMDQSYAAICPKFIGTIIAHQQADGGFGDVGISALCLRALCLNRGHGQTIERGMAYLALLQQPGGIWPQIPFRRMPADALVSAFTLLQLGDNEKFRAAVQFDAAINWFEMHAPMLDCAAQTLWSHARVRTAPALVGMPPSWS